MPAAFLDHSLNSPEIVVDSWVILDQFKFGICQCPIYPIYSILGTYLSHMWKPRLPRSRSTEPCETDNKLYNSSCERVATEDRNGDPKLLIHGAPLWRLGDGRLLHIKLHGSTYVGTHVVLNFGTVRSCTNVLTYLRRRYVSRIPGMYVGSTYVGKFYPSSLFPSFRSGKPWKDYYLPKHMVILHTWQHG